MAGLSITDHTRQIFSLDAPHTALRSPRGDKGKRGYPARWPRVDGRPVRRLSNKCALRLNALLRWLFPYDA
jgi:hypothetical protein